MDLAYQFGDVDLAELLPQRVMTIGKLCKHKENNAKPISLANTDH